ncbi:Hypothetical predicted protein [Olea europaea subsp. europaea]|uniref:Large ribosomal subunit protein mL54 n=1 Tax=Olea europaea subsp. europaea TaxID=158383 RepID=A0A8S0VNF2_OLEEU|nr:Hypothetical predicted protein [Olea europaea subsp. europaea]
MPVNHIKSLRSITVPMEKGSKGGAAADAPKASILSKEVISTTVVVANILKDGTDPEYPDWAWHLLDKRLALSELRRKDVETLPYEDLKRFVKLDNRARIKEISQGKEQRKNSRVVVFVSKIDACRNQLVLWRRSS